MADVLDRAMSWLQVAKAEKKAQRPRSVYMADPNSTVPLMEERGRRPSATQVDPQRLQRWRSKNLHRSLGLRGWTRPSQGRPASSAQDRPPAGRHSQAHRHPGQPGSGHRQCPLQPHGVVSAAAVRTASPPGFVIEPMAGIKEKMSPEEKKAFEEAVTRAERKLTTCGATEFFGTEERYVTFSQYLWQSTRSALSVSAALRRKSSGSRCCDGEKKFHAFRAASTPALSTAASTMGAS
jgi:hypothetical protein